MLKPDFIDPAFFGCPFHGLIQAGQIALPNGQIKTCPQPRSFEWSDAGKTLLQRMPWASVTRTPEQATDDTTKGYEWRTDALLGGAVQQLHGQEVQGWIYAGPDGKAWHVSAWPFEGSYGTSFSETLTVSLFGRVNGTPEQHSLAVTLADTGQGAPSIAETVWGEVLDITPDGSKAIIMLWAKTERPQFTVTALDKMSTGFLLVELAGTPGVDFTATLSVLRTREQTFGQSNDTGPIPFETVPYYTGSDTTIESVIVGEADCSGHRETTITPNVWPNTGSGESFTIGVRNGSRTQGISNRIVAMWFDGAGIPTDVLLTFSVTYAATGPELTQTVSGQDVRREYHIGGSAGVCEYGPTEYLEYYTRTYSRQVAESVAVDMTLTHGAGQVTGSMGRTTTRDYTFTRTVEGSFSENYATDDAVSTAHGSYQETDAGEWSWRALPAGGPSQIGYTDDQRLRLSEPFFLGIFVGNVFNTNRLGWLRESNNLISLYLVHDADGVTTWHMDPAVHPGGTDPSTVSTAGAIPRYSSYHPATGQVSRHNTQPACWT